MGRHSDTLHPVWTPHILFPGMVHWYAAPVSVARGIAIRPSFSSEAPRNPKDTSTNPITVAYSLGIYLLNLFLAFLSPKFDPALEQDEGMEDGNASGLPTKEDQEFRPFVRRLPEFKFWYSTTKAIAIGFFCSWFEIFNLPVFWPVLVVYWLILFGLTSESSIRR
jgi:hypothetical protein